MQNRDKTRPPCMSLNSSAKIRQASHKDGGNGAQLKSISPRTVLSVLPLRQRFRNRLKKAVKRAARDDKNLALVILSLSPYKSISQTVGPAAADRLIRCASKRLTSILRVRSKRESSLIECERGEVEYWGGDEFAILLTNVNGSAQVAATVKAIQEKLEYRIFYHEHEVYPTSNIGIALYPVNGSDAETLMRNAVAAVDSAKNSGSPFRFYTQEMNERGLRRLSLQNQLLRAFKRKEFAIHYQPQVNTRTWQLTGAEALIRWDHPDLGLIPPSDFVPLAEETGLIVPIGEWVLLTACSQLRSWRDQGFRKLRLAVNVSTRQLWDSDASNKVFRILEESSIDPACLELELTENSIMSDTPRLLEVLHQLKVIGVKLAIDDFGTGFSSLDHLRCLPVDTIKIDRSFIRNASAAVSDAALVSSIIALGHQLKLDVIAEGVETEEQLSFLTELGCDGVQGYLFSEPLTPVVFEDLLSKESYALSSSAC